MPGNRGPIGGTFEDLNEAIIKPVRDEVGEALEQGVQSVTAKPLTPQQQQQKLQDQQKKLQSARAKIAWWKKIDEEQKKVREEKKQGELQKQQLEQQEQQAKQQEKIEQFEIVQKEEQLHPAIAAKGKAEIKRGVGG